MLSAVPGQAAAVAEGEDIGLPAFSPIPVEVPGQVDLKVVHMEAVPVTGGTEVSLQVAVEGGRLLVDSVTVEHAATLPGPWNEVGTIDGDGMAYGGTVTAPEGGTGFLRATTK